MTTTKPDDRVLVTAPIEHHEINISPRDALRLVEILEDDSGPNDSLVAAAARFADWTAGQQRTTFIEEDDANA